MKKFSTPESPTMTSPSQNEKPQSDARPRKSAIDFIRQFARSYHYEPRLASLGSISVN